MLEKSPLFPVLPAQDLDRAKSWYSDKLGLEPAMEIEERNSAVYDHAGSRFLLYQSEFAGSNQATAAGFIVEDFDEVATQLRANGVVFEELDFGEAGKTVDGVINSPDGLEKGAWFKDSEGNILAISTMPA
jgi:catechol 2,3-dioxygenase-like lactoylglutathione lyase family enzyme